MAVDLNRKRNNHSTFTFTLPISCQICLGKVKMPVLCSNNHVFCSPCMDVWLEKNQLCPACRTTIGPTNPVRKILGGLNPGEDDQDELTNPDLRKARFGLLYREYEEEFEKLHSEVQLLKTENQILKQKGPRKFNDDPQSEFANPGKTDINGLLTLTKKLQDASKLYEKLKFDMKKVKQENNGLKDENNSLTRENERRRVEVVSRSPHRYGITTVATLETKIQNYEKEMNRLNKALEKSDNYIDDLENTLRKNRSNRPDLVGAKYSSVCLEAPSITSIMRDGQGDTKKISDRRGYNFPDDKSYSDSKYSTSTTNVVTDSATKSRLFPLGTGSSGNDAKTMEQSDIGKYVTHSTDFRMHGDSHQNDRGRKTDSQGKDKSVKRVTFDLPKESSGMSTFDLELPSPVVSHPTSKLMVSVQDASPVKGVLKKPSKDDDWGVGPSTSGKSSHLSNQDLQLYGMRSKDDSELASRQLQRYNNDFPKSAYTDDLDLDVTGLGALEDSLGLDTPSRYLERSDTGLDDTQVIEGELDDLNISHTSDFTDCLKLLNRAEKKVHKREDYLDPKFLTSSAGNDIQAETLSNAYDLLCSRKNPVDIAPDDLDLMYGPSSKLTYNSRPSTDFTTPSNNFYSSLPAMSHQPQNLPTSDSSYSSLPLSSHLKKYPTNSVGTSIYSSAYHPEGADSKSTLTRSPSLDSLFMHKSGSRNRRLSTDVMTSDQQFASSSVSGKSMTEDLAKFSTKGKDYLTNFHPERNYAGSKLPVRTGSLSDIGTSVTSTGFSARTADSGVGISSMSRPAALEFCSQKLEMDRLTTNKDNLLNKPPLPRSLASSTSKLPMPSYTMFNRTSGIDSYQPKYMVPSSSTHVTSSLISSTSQLPFSVPSSSTSYVSSSSLGFDPSTRPSTDIFAKAGPRDLIAESTNAGRYSYLSTDTSFGDFSRQSDLSLPEPKKKLFSTADDLELSLSPIKATPRF